MAAVLTSMLGDGELPAAVTVDWGRPGTAQREIRAAVTALPFKPDHRRADVSAR